ncbi:UDP-N-acetylmuramoyl-L-alanine--D-glutamate ligase [Helcobacillus massiliensis]|uniref:UDP-N-acetylmuramoylalanine--D-glutamate ligase n=1 Tax=Helcobacillus massiliensis TaxID=521392 RepID=A0A839R0G9_9MICO|nr:UDP-N-acetylmuramoylalanine--D-glutamate ligase [Helcobacillus massiliensis]
MDASQNRTPLAERPWPGLDVSGARILVAGFGVSGYAVVDQTLQRGAHVVAVDGNDSPENEERAEILRVLGADIRLGAGTTDRLPDGDIDVVITSPGWRPDQPLLAEAAQRGIPVWSEVELARRMQPEGGPAWLTVTGTNGKTTVVTMLEHILRTAGIRAVAAGNVGLPVIEAALDPIGFEVLAVELSSFQLHWTQNLHAEASCILTISDDHLDWHGGADEYAAAKGRIYDQTITACLYNLHEDRTRTLLEEADVVEGCRAIGVGLGTPGPSELGIVDDLLVDRAFVPERHRQAAELTSLTDLAHLGPHGAPAHVVFNALNAAGLARAVGVEPAHIRDGLRTYSPGEHRIQVVHRSGGITWVDDSKATNPDAARAALASAQSIVWIAGGDTKGAPIGDLVAGAADCLRAVVLIGTDATAFTDALTEHAPSVPVVRIDPDQEADSVMRAAVRAAREHAADDDVVLLAPAAASIDQFRNYAERGRLFQRAVLAEAGA